MLRPLLPHLSTSLPSTPLGRFRGVALVGAILGVALALEAVVAAREVAVWIRVFAALPAPWLVWHWVRGWRRGSFPPAAEPFEVAAILALMAVAHGDPALPLFALMFRSLYGSVAISAVRAGVYIAGLYAGQELQDPAGLDNQIGRALGLAVAAVMMQGVRIASERSARSEQLLRAVVEQSADIACIVGPDLRVAWVGAGRDDLGLGVDRWVGRDVADLVHPDDAPALECLHTELAPGERRTQPFRLRRAGGTHLPVEGMIVNRVDDPALRGYLVNVRDTSERARLEAERVELARLREQVTAQRQRQELEARLQRSERLGSVGQLAGGIAHDFNNLLGIIINYAGFVREGLPPGDALRRDLAEVEAAAERGASLTRQLLMFSRHRSSRPEVVDLNRIVGGLERLLGPSLGGEVRLRGEHAPGLWAVTADPGVLEQIVVNLVINARDATGAGGTICTVTENVALDAAAAARLELAPGRYVRLAVRDDGCGMDEETQRRALEPFFTTKPSGQGTGLGLATVFGAATTVGGTVALDTAPGAGTTVSVYLPVTEDEPARRDDLPADHHGSGGQRVLVVDDEPSLRGLVERLLRAEGYAVTVADCGERALAVAEAAPEPFDLVVTDVVMPGLSGIEVAARLRAGGDGPRVLLMSGHSDELLTRRGADGDPLLHKPFNATALRLAVRDALSSSTLTAITKEVAA